MRVAVAGGTGVVGRHVVEALRAAGDEPVVLARSTGADLVTGRGLRDAMAGADAVIDVSNVAAMGRRKAVAFFEAATNNLLGAESANGVQHHVVLSIVGCDRVDLGYYVGKRRQEDLVRTGPVPASILRATQFHEFAGQLLDRGGPLPVVPRWRAQTVAAREVAAALVDAVHHEPAGALPELAGPEQRWMLDLVRAVAAARGLRRPVLGVTLPGRAGRALAGGALLPRDDGPRGCETFDVWLAPAG